MAPAYKLTYFNVRGVAEGIRFLFAYGDLEYEDKRVEHADFPKIKDSLPFGQLPVLEHKGKQVNQSGAIARYIAKQVNLSGKTDWENLEIDAIVDTLEDSRSKFPAIRGEPDEDKRKALIESFLKDTFAFYLDRLEKLAAKNGGYLCLGRVSDVFEEPFRTIVHSLLQMCAYAGTGDVLVIQELLRLIEGRTDLPEPPKPESSSTSSEDPTAPPKPKQIKKAEWDLNLGKAVSVLAVAAISKGEDIGAEMIQRIFCQISRYGEPGVRKAVPLAIALSCLSNPETSITNVLTKFSHDADDDVACNAIFGLGCVGAGTNNARLAVGLRQLALYHSKNPFQLFMVRIAQGLIHLGKGTMTLNPMHTDRQLMDPVAMAGILIPLVALLKPHTLILGRSHYLLYTLAAAIQPRWLLSLDENLNSISATVRVGQAVDTVGKAGAPKTIAGIHTHTTPVLLCANERAELANGEYEAVTAALDGVCILKKIA